MTMPSLPQRSSAEPASAGRVPALVAFGHARWDLVFQRPQHLLTRMAAFRRVYYIEAPLHEPSQVPGWERRQVMPNVWVCRARLPQPLRGLADYDNHHFARLLAGLAATEDLADCVAWLCTPWAYPLLSALSPAAVVYDCGVDWQVRRQSAPGQDASEAAVLAGADLVFTGSPSLYRALLGRHPHLYLFPSAVDNEHFSPARPGAAQPPPLPDDLAALRRPRLGFYGTLDERLDLDLLAALADAHPEWEIVLVGPVVGLSPDELPQRSNLHYLGARPYQSLPAYLAGWDLCVLPYARGATTRFLSPTKLLEYMAAERQIVSTPVPDVAENFGQAVYLGDATQGFIMACERALADSEPEHARRVHKMRALRARSSWAATARAMEFLIDRALRRRQFAAARAVAVPSLDSVEDSLARDDVALA